ncbi:MAG: ABC transporter substrate-binding protein [Planctomycetota bacterium]
MTRSPNARAAGALLLLLTALPTAAAQERAPEPARARLGVFFWHDSPNDLATLHGIRQGLEASGRPFELIERRAGADAVRANAMLAELRAEGCALVFAMGTQAALIALQALPDLPIVFAAVQHPVASGVVPDWAGAHGRVAGASYWIEPAAVLRVFRMAVPGLRRLGMLRSLPTGVVSDAELLAMHDHLGEAAAPDVELLEAVAADAADIPRAVGVLIERGADAIWIPNDLTIYLSLDRVREGLRGARVPLVATALRAARADAVVGVTVDFALHGRRTAALALRILDGAAPGDLPVDTMQSYRVIANLRAARRAGCALPLSLLALADELIADPATADGDARDR